MNTTSQLKAYDSGKYTYIYIYYKYKGNPIRINTKKEYKKGYHRKDLYYNTKMEGYELLNLEIHNLQTKVNYFISIELNNWNPNINQKACVEYLNTEKFTSLTPDIRLNVQNNPQEKTFYEHLIKYWESRKESGKRQTAKEFKTIANRIQRFDEYRGKKTYFKDLNFTWSDAFYLWAQQHYTEGTIGKHYTTMYTAINNYYKRRDELDIELSDKFRDEEFRHGGISRNDANPLTSEQRDILFSHRFEDEKLEKVRKMMCIQAFTAVRHSDLDKLRPEMFDNDTLRFKPQKTKTNKYKVVVEQPLFSQAKELLEEVDYNTSCYKIANQNYNPIIREVIVALAEKYEDKGFDKIKDFSSHNLRDTYISIAVERGVNFKSILKFVGQSSYTIMDRYIKLTTDFERKEADKMK